MIGRSNLWSVRKEQGRADKPATKESVDKAMSTSVFVAARDEAFELLGIDEEDRGDQLVGGSFGGRTAREAFATLEQLDDRSVLRIMTVAMAESLEAGTGLVGDLGLLVKVDLATLWQADDAFLDLVTSKDTLISMLQDIGGGEVAAAHKASTGKTIRSVIRQFATGEGREKVQGWVPSQMLFKEQLAEPEAPADEAPFEESEEAEAA